MINLANIRAFIFDFDGVIVRGSEDIKRRAWSVCDDLDPIALDSLDRYRRKYAQGKGSRFDILRGLVHDLGYRGVEAEALAAEYARRYNDLVQNEIRLHGVAPADFDIIRSLAATYDLYINSATPEAALIESISALGLQSFFKGVFGQPKSKVENIYRALALSSCGVDTSMFIGDGSGDAQAAQEAGCPFIGVASLENGWGSGDQTFPVIENIAGLEGWFTNVRRTG